ncbi:MAG: excinuclease ABC subunit UvrA [Lentimicrobiaceae bacterium]|jgi:excinuclease ABC subunit A|nr:excinuclease ABC subunit UvrA [Lentimicrobiaceae bacterium]
MKDSFVKTNKLDNITIRNANVNNLKNISLNIPKNKLIVVTGLSGSGKSSLAFDTLYAEGQRRYVESLSSYARQFLGRMHKPDVESITGISPAIAIEQRVNSRNPRSTVGTSTEIYEYIKLLFARIGQTYSPVSGKLVKRHQTSDVIHFIQTLSENTLVYITAPIKLPKTRTIEEHLEILMQQGFRRLLIKSKVETIEDVIDQNKKLKTNDIKIVIDRIKTTDFDTETLNRLGDSIQTAFYEGKENCIIVYETDGIQKSESFSSQFESDGIIFEPPSVNMFAFNNPFGACKTCEGFGSIIGIDPDLVIPNKSLSIYDNAIVCWKGEKSSEWRDELIKNASRFDFPIHKPYYSLSDAQKKILWTGNQYFRGINDYFKFVEEQAFKIQYRVIMSRYRGKTTCPECNGTRLRKDTQYVKVGGKNISEIVLMPLTEVKDFFDHLKLSKTEQTIASRLLIEIQSKVNFLLDVGLGYLTLNRLSNTLSGGESQRINLATSLGSSLVGSTYILDEPSIGLHSRDTERLIKVLKQLRDIGNTVIIVEHDEEIIKAADQIIDIGPLSGSKGGELVFQGTFDELLKDDKSLTAQYVSGKREIPVPKHRRKWNNYIEIIGANENNLKNLNVKFPLNCLTVVTGVSGSGKSSLVRTILYAALKKHFGGTTEKIGSFVALEGSVGNIQTVELIDQNPIGRSSRSNPVTYIKAFDDIRMLFSEQKLAKLRGYKPGYFSFNVPGGRCDNCEGEGTVKIEMQFMADVVLECEECKGRRFKDDVLEILVDTKNIAEILDMTIDDAIDFFSNMKKNQNIVQRIISKLLPLQQIGLGYLKLGQSSSTLSGGEAQRIKLAFFLTKGQIEKPTLFVFDEPTTGLHIHDINKLLEAFNALIENGHSIIVIEHNAEIIKCADWLIDLGLEGGNEGGHLVFEGTPENMIKENKSYTAHTIKNKLK